MDKNRSSRSVRGPSKPAAGSPGESDRLSIGSFENRSSRGGSREFTTSRSRKRKRREEQGRGKLLWFSIAGIVALYILLLGVHTVSSRSVVDPAPASIERVEPSSESAAEEVRPGPVAGPSEDVEPVVSVSNFISNITRAQQLTREGQKQLMGRRYASAKKQLDEAVELAPNMYDSLIELAKVLQEQKDDLRAREILLRAISVNPNDLAARVMLAQTLFRLREYENALSAALWVLQAQPYSEQAHQIAADVYTSLDLHRDAIYHWEKIAALNADNFTAKNNLGTALLHEGQLGEAISVFEGVLREDPGNSQAYYYMAICFVQKDEPELAVGVLSSAATHLGIQFVKAWVKGPEFDDIRDLPEFQRQFSDDGSPILPES